MKLFYIMGAALCVYALTPNLAEEGAHVYPCTPAEGHFLCPVNDGTKKGIIVGHEFIRLNTDPELLCEILIKIANIVTAHRLKYEQIPSGKKKVNTYTTAALKEATGDFFNNLGNQNKIDECAGRLCAVASKSPDADIRNLIRSIIQARNLLTKESEIPPEFRQTQEQKTRETQAMFHEAMAARHREQQGVSTGASISDNDTSRVISAPSTVSTADTEQDLSPVAAA